MATGDGAMTELESTWLSLEQDAINRGPGIYLRRILPDRPRDIFLCTRSPETHRSLVLGLNHQNDNVAEGAFRSAGISVVANPDDLARHGHDSSLEIRLTDPEYQAVFGTLVSDVIDVFEEESDERAAASSVIRRLNSWQKLLARSRPDGLTPEQQRGLFGELRVLRDLLTPLVGLEMAIRTWTGPDDAAHDFELEKIALEVKSTIEIRPTHLRISSEHQLDTEGVESLYLIHNQFDTRAEPGISLVEMVEFLREASAEVSVGRLFEEKLITAGYLETHRDRYTAPKYLLREELIYSVATDFPRVVSSTLPLGVEQIRYLLAISSLENHKTDPETFAAKIGVSKDD